MSKENFQYDGLMGLTFIDEDGNEMPAEDAMTLNKASFGGDRSAAGRYAAQARWAKSPAAASSSHGLKTDLPVTVMSDGTVRVTAENGALRPPTAAERGIPTGKEFTDSIKSDLDALKAVDPVVHQELMKKWISPTSVAINRAHKRFVEDGFRYSGSDKPASDFAWSLRYKAESVGYLVGSNGNYGRRFPERGALGDRIVAAIDNMRAQLDTLENPATA